MNVDPKEGMLCLGFDFFFFDIIVLHRKENLVLVPQPEFYKDESSIDIIHSDSFLYPNNPDMDKNFRI